MQTIKRPLDYCVGLVELVFKCLGDAVEYWKRCALRKWEQGALGLAMAHSDSPPILALFSSEGGR